MSSHPALLPFHQSRSEAKASAGLRKGGLFLMLGFSCVTLLLTTVQAGASAIGPDDPPCRSQDAYCRGFVAGLLESLRIAGRVCVPEAVSTSRVEIIVRDWLALNPKLVAQGGSEVISAALIKSFPCRS